MRRPTLLLALALVAPAPSGLQAAPGAEAPRGTDPDVAVAPPPTPEKVYRDTLASAHDLWKERPPLTRRDEQSCITAWQKGDEVRTMLQAATPPSRYAPYHTALLGCVDAALAVSDECLLQPGGGPKWMVYLQTMQRSCNAVTRVVRESKVDLPGDWR